MSAEGEEPPKKRSRRRLRVSCVECTRRRQKCDREQPCGLCKARNVEHLCRWELEPFARPKPNRPPGQKTAIRSESESPGDPVASDAADSPPASGTTGSHSSLAPTPGLSSGLSSSGFGLSTVDVEVKEAAIALAQLSMARHNEYLGTGSAVCALHRLTDSDAKFPTDTSNPIPFNPNNAYNSTLSTTFTRSLQDLVSNFPDKVRCDTLIESFFKKENWYFGLPEKQVCASYKGMWWTIQSDLTSIQRINFNWVALLFSMFALSSATTTEDESRKYYLQALTARRLEEDMLSASFLSPKDSATTSSGTAYGCIAASLMSKYLCDRGQMTEAWKLIGNALRAAQNSGLHLNPYWNRWKDMTREEQALRSIAFHTCALHDRFLSFCLGRPVMARWRDFDIPLCAKYTKTLESDGTSDTNGKFSRSLFELMCYVGEAKDKFLSVHPDKGNGVAFFEASMSKWETTVPPFLAPQNPDRSFDSLYPYLSMQRTTLAVHYYACCMLFYRSLPCAQITSLNKSNAAAQWDLKKLSSNAMKLVELQREHTSLSLKTWARQVCFTFSHLTFEAGVTLSICILRDPTNEAVEEWCRTRDEAIDMLQDVANRDNGNLVKQSLLVLRVLQDQRPRRDASQDTPSSTSVVTPMQLNTPDTNIPLAESGLSLHALDPQLMIPTNNSFWPDMSKSLDFSLGDRIPSGMDGSFSAFDFLFGIEDAGLTPGMGFGPEQQMGEYAQVQHQVLPR